MILIVKNYACIPKLAEEVRQVIQPRVPGVLISNLWRDSDSTAKRHLEAFEVLFEYQVNMFNLNKLTITFKKENFTMANIRIRNTNERLTQEQEVKRFLDEQGVLYEHWNMEKLPSELREQFILSDEKKEEILNIFDSEIRSLANRRGYEEWDLIALSDATPNLDELLKKFEQVHVHTEDEVRAITAGNGIFTIKGNSGYFDVELSAGDVISVPVNIPHFFTLMENRQVVAVRLFIDASGWVAHSYEDPEFKS